MLELISVAEKYRDPQRPLRPNMRSLFAEGQVLRRRRKKPEFSDIFSTKCNLLKTSELKLTSAGVVIPEFLDVFLAHKTFPTPHIGATNVSDNSVAFSFFYAQEANRSRAKKPTDSSSSRSREDAEGLAHFSSWISSSSAEQPAEDAPFELGRTEALRIGHDISGVRRVTVAKAHRTEPSSSVVAPATTSTHQGLPCD